MFDTIILLTGALERTALASVLHGHRPQLMVHAITTSEDLAAIDRDVLRRARLIAFASPVIVSPGVLSALGFGAYNFHPGPPEYPGWAPAHFALYEGATEFGATAHAMAQRVDSGPIVDVSRFTFPADMDVAALEGLTYAHLARMYWRHAKHLATEAHSLPEMPLSWAPRKNSRRGYQALCDIPLDISKEELNRRMRVFGGNHFGMTPVVRLHGVQFRAVT